MNRTLDYKTILAIAVLLAIVGIFSIIWQKPWQAGASVQVSNGYLSTTTPNTGLVANGGLLCTGPSVLGSVIVMGVGTNVILVDGTTTDVTKRTGNLATTTIVKAWLPNNATTSTYTYDLTVDTGLTVGTAGTGAATTTITYRCNE